MIKGKRDTVSFVYEEYKNMNSRIELLETLAEAENDMKNGLIAPMSDTFDSLRRTLKKD